MALNYSALSGTTSSGTSAPASPYGMASRPGGKSTLTTPTGTFQLGKKATQSAGIADYQGFLNQQAIDKQTEANRARQETPWGTVDWSQGPDGQWTQKTTLTPEQQAALDSQQKIQSGLSGMAGGMLGSIGDKYAKEMDWSGFTPKGTVAQAPGMDQFQKYGKGPDLQTDFGSYDPMALAGLGGASGGSTSVERAKEYDLQKDLDYSGLGAMPEADDATRQRVEEAQFQRAKSRLDPQWAERERAAQDRAYAMGQREGDPAMASVMDPLGRERNDAYNQATWESIASGGQEQSRLFDMAMAKRQQGKSEIDTQGSFRNDALMNQFQQGSFNAGQANQVGMANASNATQANIASANNRIQGFGMGMDYNLKAGDMANRAKMSSADYDRAGNDQWNQLIQQGYGNQRNQFADTNVSRDRDIQEALAQRNQPLNELNALLGGQQVKDPNFGGYSQAGAAEAQDFYGAYRDKVADAQAAAASRNAMIGSAVGAAGSMFAMSDRRLKSNIVRVGTTKGGHGWYEYDIGGRREQGVMAQEVPASWTALHSSGYLMVDYSKVM